MAGFASLIPQQYQDVYGNLLDREMMNEMVAERGSMAGTQGRLPIGVFPIPPKQTIQPAQPPISQPISQPISRPINQPISQPIQPIQPVQPPWAIPREEIPRPIGIPERPWPQTTPTPTKPIGMLSDLAAPQTLSEGHMNMMNLLGWSQNIRQSLYA